MAVDLTQWSTVAPLMGVLPSWLGKEDAERIEAYRIYEQMYDNVPDTYQLAQRGSDSQPIYIPAPKIIVEATNRFLATGWQYMVNPRIGTPQDQSLVTNALAQLFKRELFYAKFSTQKRYCLIRGDAVWHFVGDPLKPEGRRISIYEVDPASYFPIYDVENLERIVGCHLVDRVKVGDDNLVRRQTYRKDPERGTITSETTLWEEGKWDDRNLVAADLSQKGVITPLFELPPSITSLPVYHIKNSRIPGAPFGGSELKGIERLAAAVNQAISDEELSLALDGIGVYATTSGPPTDASGAEVNWRLGPGRVAELGDQADKFWRVTGVGSVAPYLDHVRFIMGTMQQSAAVPDVAAGNVDVSVAESGIALYLQLAPILAKNAEKEQEMLGVYDHMLYDLVQMWLPSYEGTPAGIATEVVSIIDDPMPVNREVRVQEIMALVAAKIVSIEYAREELSKFGYRFPDNMGETVVAETTALASAETGDVFGSRAADELGVNADESV